MTPTVIVRFGALLAAAGLMLQPGFGQGTTQGAGTSGTTTGAGGAAGGTTTGGGGPTTGNSPRQPSIPSVNQPSQQQTQQQQQQQQQMQQPIFLSGRVMMEDGTPAANVVIQRVCSGSSKGEGYTDSRGYFSIQLGARNGAMIHDASEDQPRPTSTSALLRMIPTTRLQRATGRSLDRAARSPWRRVDEEAERKPRNEYTPSDS